MTPQQEAKLDQIYAIALRSEGRLDVHEEKFKSHFTAITGNAKEINDVKEIATGYVADRNKAIGVTWIGAILGAITGVGALIISIYKHL